VKLANILATLDEISPLSLAASWDNVGLLVGAPDSEVCEVVLSLECTQDVLNLMQKDSLLIVHHPLIFKPIKNLNFDNWQAKLIRTMVQKNISLIAMHTNFDITHLNKAFAKLLGLEGVSQGVVYQASFNSTFNNLCYIVKQKLSLKNFSAVLPKNDIVNSVAVICGSGGDFMDSVKADVLITGDVKYHQAISAQERGLGVIDATHYASEKHFAPLMQGILSENGIKSVIINSYSPFRECV
jgi:dinuclear metal center YbgI/SA1388 family protein